jgi:hypothetical protein
MDSLKNIINLIFFVNIDDPTRKRNIVDARIAYSKILKDAGFSYQHIGDSIKKDHSTIIHYVKSVDGLLRYDNVFQKKFLLAKKNFVKENKQLTLNSKEDIYAIAINLENRFNEIISKKTNVLQKLEDYEKENGQNESINYCRSLILSLFDD